MGLTLEGIAVGIISKFFGHSLSPNFVSPRDSERQDRLQRYRKTWEAYLAELPDPIKKDGPANDNVKVNPARAIVNTGVYFLFGSELVFKDSAVEAKTYGQKKKEQEEKKPEPSAEETKPKDPTKPTESKAPPKPEFEAPDDPEWLVDLNKTWKANRKKSFLYNMGLSGSLHGDVFIKMVPNGAGEFNEYTRLVTIDPANVDVVVDPNDCNLAIKYSIEYVVEDEEGRPKLQIQEITADREGLDGPITSWVLQEFEHSMTFDVAAGWLPMQGGREPLSAPETWPYSWPPIEHAQNVELPHMYWGLPDLDEASVDVILSLQRSMSSLNKIVRVHASPRMFAKNVTPDLLDDIDISADNIIALPTTESDLNVLQVLQNISPSIEFTDKLREDLYEMLQVPPIAMGKVDSTQAITSGVMLSILYAPILQKTELKRISYGDMIERLCRKLLVLMGYDNPDEYEGLTLVWPEAVPGSSFIDRQTLVEDQKLGASMYTLLARLGYDPEEETARKQDELRAQEEMKSEFMERQARLNAELNPPPEPGMPGGGVPGQKKPPGGNNNPNGNGNNSGGMGGTKAAGTPKKKPEGK